MYKILLTGSSGFIGSNILNNFSKDYKFYILVRKKPLKTYLKNKNIKVIQFKNYNSLNLKLKKMREQVNTIAEPLTFYFMQHRVDLKPSVDGVLYEADIYRLLNGNDYSDRDFAYVETVTAIQPELSAERARQFILNKITS